MHLPANNTVSAPIFGIPLSRAGMNMVVRRSDGKMCLSDDQFRDLLHEQQEHIDNEYRGEIHALWRLFVQGAYGSMEHNPVNV